jgi:tetratricopeptide (TPR) repeat protein
MRRSLVLAVIVAASWILQPLGASLAAQRLGPHVDRPKIDDLPDTNDAHAYFDAGLRLFKRDPKTASAAFYWAARLDPGWGDPLYARRAALIVQKPALLSNMMSGRRRGRDNDLRRLDSLQFRALMLSPFLFRRLDQQLFMYYVTDGGRNMDSDYTYAINVWLSQAPPETRGWYSYGQGNFGKALEFYAEASKRDRDAAGLHIEQGRILGMRNAVDQSVMEFQTALELLRKKDDKDLVIFYDSKAQVEFSIAVLLEGAERFIEAREAYGRTLQEDLAYYPAHMRLGLLALGQHDTTTAVSELALAAEIATEEPFIRYMNGWVLTQANKPAEAIVELKKALEIEPYYALPNLALGGAYEQLHRAPEALAAYDRFLKSSSVSAPQRGAATARIEELQKVAAAPAKP